MTLKELSRYYNLQKQLERSRELLASLEASASPRAQALTGMPHSSGAGDKVGDLAAEIADTKAHIQRLERRAEQAAVRIRAYIDTIEDQHTRIIFRLRFIRCMTWGEVAYTIGGRNTEKGVKCTCYRYIKSCSDVRRDEP